MVSGEAWEAPGKAQTRGPEEKRLQWRGWGDSAGPGCPHPAPGRSPHLVLSSPVLKASGRSAKLAPKP